MAKLILVNEQSEVLDTWRVTTQAEYPDGYNLSKQMARQTVMAEIVDELDRDAQRTEKE